MLHNMDYEYIDHATTGQLIDFWKHFRAAFRAQGASSPIDLTDPEFFYCVVVAAVRAKWFTGSKSERPELDAVRDWSLDELEEVAAPVWEVYLASSKKMDDEEKNS